MILASVVNNISDKVCGKKISLANRVMLHLTFFISAFSMSVGASMFIPYSVYFLAYIACIGGLLLAGIGLQSSIASISANMLNQKEVSYSASSNVFNLAVLQAVCAGVISGRFILSFLTFDPFKFALAVLIFAVCLAFAASYSKNITSYDTKIVYRGLILSVVLGFLGMFLRLAFIEACLCAVAIPTFIGLASMRIRSLNQTNGIYSKSNLDEHLHGALASYIAADMFLILLNLFLYILRLLTFLSGNRRNR